MERETNEVRCMYCHYFFTPEPVVRTEKKKKITYIECPRCGNGIERPFRWYDARPKAVAVNG